MSEVKKIGVKNLRSLGDTGLIELKPLTILVGKNSAGKSTFARLFPLLRQSTEASRNAPFLWWGQYVDYGSFAQAVSRNAEDKTITFSFEVELTELGPRNRLVPRNRSSLNQPKITTQVEIYVKEDDDKSYISRHVVRVLDLTATIDIDPLGIVKKISCGSQNWSPDTLTGAFIEEGQYLSELTFFRHLPNPSKDVSDTVLDEDPFHRRLTRLLKLSFHGNTSSEKIDSIVRSIQIASADECMARIKARMTSSMAAAFEKNVQKRPGYFQEVRELKFLMDLSSLLGRLNYELDQFARSVRYLGPIRATAQRFYRPQELSISDMDPRGENLAVLLNDMQNKWYFNKFNHWLRQYLGFEVLAEKQGYQIELKIRYNGSSESTNLTDTGFGLSQILPIATQLWLASNARLTRGMAQTQAPKNFIVVEQPELHLHPAFQGRLADLFVGAIYGDAPMNTSSNDVSIVAETHSSSLVNRIGELIAEQRIPAADVQVILFDQATPSSPVSLTLAHFDDEGILKNWPYGFFSAGAYE